MIKFSKKIKILKRKKFTWKGMKTVYLQLLVKSKKVCAGGEVTLQGVTWKQHPPAKFASDFHIACCCCCSRLTRCPACERKSFEETLKIVLQFIIINFNYNSLYPKAHSSATNRFPCSFNIQKHEHSLVSLKASSS